MHFAFVFKGVMHVHRSDCEGAEVLNLNIVKGLTVKPYSSWAAERVHIALAVEAPALSVDIDEPGIEDLQKL